VELKVRYQSRFVYPDVVRDSHNVLRACPIDDDWQTRVSYFLEVKPQARVFSYTDSWGTRVDCFGVDEPHRELTVVAESVAVTRPRPSPPDPVPIKEVHDPRFAEEHSEYLPPTSHTRWSDPLARTAAVALEGAETLQEAVERIDRCVRDRMAYRPGTTYIGVDVNEVFARGEGVCQDFVHATLAMLRSQELPARYVSGYFYAEDSSSGIAPEREEIEVQTHAWVEVAVPGWGWWGIDPTNAQPAGERHLKIGHGRDYDDVLPLRGVYIGKVDHLLAAGVVISRSDLSAVHFREPDGQQQQQQQ
jgi:transglutaminase-like putative cysteine protease